MGQAAWSGERDRSLEHRAVSEGPEGVAVRRGIGLSALRSPPSEPSCLPLRLLHPGQPDLPPRFVLALVT